jgi:hypothetical protein
MFFCFREISANRTDYYLILNVFLEFVIFWVETFLEFSLEHVKRTCVKYWGNSYWKGPVHIRNFHVCLCENI